MAEQRKSSFGGGRSGGGRSEGGRPSSGGRPCPFSSDVSPKIDYKDPRLLGSYVSERGKLVPSRISGVSQKAQRRVRQAIMRARFLALLPYVKK